MFDFDLFTVRIPGSESPGSELLDRFGSQSADTEGSSNLIGVRDPAVDALVNLAVSAHDAAGAGRAPARARPRAAPRPLRRAAVVLRAPSASPTAPASSSSPQVAPQYYQPEDWVISTWWRKK